MKASEALKLSRENLVNHQELENVFSKIRGVARQGEFKTFFVDLSKPTKDELIRLGYIVTSHFSKNESTDTVAWYEIEVKG